MYRIQENFCYEPNWVLFTNKAIFECLTEYRIIWLIRPGFYNREERPDLHWNGVL